ncbi:C40 family peptidase, partial [Escherichia coli]|nr:C40 family peptidase [Escherichia coli]
SNPSTGFDCSGLMQWAYAKAGIQLPRTSYEQYKFSQRITQDELQPGDLIFFSTASYAPVTHVGMYVGNGKMYNSNDSGVVY